MLTMGEPRAIVVILQTTDSLLKSLCRLCQLLDHISGRSILERVPQVCELINLT